MSDETGTIPDGEAVSYPVDSTEPISLEEAVRDLTAAREKAINPQPAESAKEATADPELSDEDNSAPETDPAEEPDAAEPEAIPPIEPPRSWTKAEKERFQSLPRETQEYLHTREQERERDFRRSQNEAAEDRKAAQAERAKVEELRKQYEGQLPALMQELQNAQQNTFSDIRTVDDVTKLAAEDPFRYLQWQAHQTKLQAVNAENERARREAQQAQQTEWQSYVAKQNELASEYIPDLADKTKSQALTLRAAERLNELGFNQEELARLANGQEKLSLHDHRIQRLIFSDLRLQDMQAAPKAVSAKPLPPVQRPGTARPASSSSAAQIQTLEKQLSTATGDKAARLSAEIWRLEKRAAAR